uniref:Uncharacterized protein n=1 Tax=Lysinibacillus sphaericus TaxID=1421 RepID=A0A6H0A1C6_LYSSH|nr:hypothetical protein [Lysinibacillus sphaericus]
MQWFLNNRDGSIVAITNFHHKFKRSKVKVAIKGLETKGQKRSG